MFFWQLLTGNSPNNNIFQRRNLTSQNCVLILTCMYGNTNLSLSTLAVQDYNILLPMEK